MLWGWHMASNREQFAQDLKEASRLVGDRDIDAIVAFANRHNERVAEKLAAEAATGTSSWDVVIDDPEMLSRHELRGVMAKSADHAGVIAMMEAYRREGFRCVASDPPGDERLMVVAVEAALLWATVHLSGGHPGIDYSRPEERIRLVGGIDPRTGLPLFERLIDESWQK